MKLFVLLLVPFFSFVSQAQAKSSGCTWVDSSYASAAFYSKTKKASKGWIYCEENEANLTSVLLERYQGTYDQWIQKYAKESLPDMDKIERKSKTVVKVEDQKINRIIVKVKASSETYDMAFFFLKKEGRQYVFSTTFLKRPFKKDLAVATKEVQKVVRTQSKLFKN